jgi:dynamin 1-like protein
MQNAAENIAYLGGALGNVAGNLATSMAAYAKAKPQSQICTMGCAEILKVSNALQGIFSTAGESALKIPELPQIVVIGSQSSGKSSLLNGIMAADILPLGEQMVTRTPLHLHLVNHESMRAEFGSSASGSWKPHWNIELTDPNPTAAEIEAIRRQIEVETEERAGNQKGISADPIFLKIFSPYVPDLSLVDLPGLTMTALTDQGQPQDIREQIQAMLAKYASSERSIILAVVPARQDLEADMALHFVREHDIEGNRTIGVMTKIDLMNADTDVSSYITGNIPRALQLKYGYFLVKNRSTSQVKKGVTVHQGFDQERQFFSAHKVYSKLSQCRLGVPPLGDTLSEILVEQLKAHLPSIIHEIDELAAGELE